MVVVLSRDAGSKSTLMSRTCSLQYLMKVGEMGWIVIDPYVKGVFAYMIAWVHYHSWRKLVAEHGGFGFLQKEKG